MASNLGFILNVSMEGFSLRFVGIRFQSLDGWKIEKRRKFSPKSTLAWMLVSPPVYHHERLFGSCQHSVHTRGETNIQARVDFDLSLARTSFFFQASRLWNLIPANLKLNPSLETFKKKTRCWVRSNIDVRPN